MTDPRMTPTNDAPVTVEQCDRDRAADAVLQIRGTKDGNWQKRIRHGECDDGVMCQSMARHRLAALASVPAGDGVEALMRTPAIEALTPSNDEWMRCESVQDCYDLMKRCVDRAAAALARPRAAVGEQSREAEPTADSPWAKAVWFGLERSIPRCDAAIGERELAEALRTALLQEGGDAWMNRRDTVDSFRIDGTVDLVAVARLLQSPPAKVEEKSCQCACHRLPGILHAAPCCDRTYEQYDAPAKVEG